jgi:putative PEP-CTERM system histidine kinase
MTQFLLWLNLTVCLISTVLLLWQRRYPLATILLACGLFCFAGLLYVDLQTLAFPSELLKWRKPAVLLEIGTTLGFYFYTKTLFRDNSKIYRGPGFWVSVLLALSLLLFVIAFPIEQLIYSPDFSEEKIIFLSKAGFSVYLLMMLYLVFGLVQLERTMSGLHQLQRWNVKPEVIASGFVLAALALYFSHSLLYRSLNLNYLSLRSMVVLVAILLLLYARFFRGEGDRLALSRGIAHRSFVLLIVGGYLIILGIVGEGLRYLNVNNLRPFFYTILLFGSVGLAAIFLSEGLRRKFKVILHKNFYQSKYDYRDQWQRFIRQVSDGKSLLEVQNSVLDLFCDSLACKWSALYLFDEETKNYEFADSFPARRDWRPFLDTDPLIVKLNNSDWIINLRDDDFDYQSSLVSALREDSAFLVVPLIFDEDLVGFVVLGEQITAEELTYEDYDLLKMLARQSISAIQGLRLADQLSTSRELAAIGKVSTFVLHDLKNQVSGLSLMMDNAHEYIHDPDFQQDMLETVDHTVAKMKGLIARLKNLKEKPELVLTPVILDKVIADVVTTVGGQVEVKGESVRIDADEEEIYRVVLNLVLNAQEATSANLPVYIEYGIDDKMAFITVRDVGSGMSQEFISNNLFKPFSTTKKHGFGIGLYQCRQIVESHQGRISVESVEGEGTIFKLQLPLAPKLT